MFNSILSSLSQRLPQNFFFGSYVPVLIFGFLNSVLLFVHVSGFRDVALTQIKAPSALYVTILFVATLVVAYVLSTVVNALREFLEGRYLWPPALENALRREQEKRLIGIEDRLEGARKVRHAVTIRTIRWQQNMRVAATAGTSDHPGVTGYRRSRSAGSVTDAGPSSAPSKSFNESWFASSSTSSSSAATSSSDSYTVSSSAGASSSDGSAASSSSSSSSATRDGVSSDTASIEALRESRSRGEKIDASRLAPAVRAMQTALTRFDVTRDVNLASEYRTLLNLIDYAEKNAEAEELRQYTLRQTQFGLLVPAPTRLGNVAASLESYTVSRYGLDLNTLWSRLQPVMQKGNKEAFGTIGDAKTQLDFLVTCCWLSALTTIGWFFALAIVGSSPWTFLMIAVVGPVLAIFFYSLAVANYLSYGELVRAAVDLNRFALLKELHVALPSGIRQERATWAALRQMSSFGTQGIEMSYEHPQ